MVGEEQRVDARVGLTLWYEYSGRASTVAQIVERFEAFLREMAVPVADDFAFVESSVAFGNVNWEGGTCYRCLEAPAVADDYCVACCEVLDDGS